MSSEKYIGLDVHLATISVAVMDSQGKVVMESILETKASTLLEFFAGLRGSLFVTFEEGTWAAWHYDLLKPHVSEVLVCNPRKIPLLKQGNKSDKIDARKLAERLRLHDLKPVYHGETGIRMLRELARSYLTVVKDLSRVMNRLKALYRSWAIPCTDRDVYYTRHRREWLDKIPEAGTGWRAEQLYQQLDMLQHLRQQARGALLAESRKHTITAKLGQIPALGPIGSAVAVALMQTPNRFRSKRQLWTYSGLGLETRDSGEYHYVQGQPQRRKKQATIRGLNKDYNHDLKGLCKGAATRASVKPYPESIQEWKLDGQLERDKNVVEMAAAMESGFRSGGKAGALRGAIQALLAERKAGKSFVSPYWIAQNYADLGDNDHAFEWLEIAYKERDTAIVGIPSDFMFDPIHSDSRYRELVRRIGLPQ
jgi:transposase